MDREAILEKLRGQLHDALATARSAQEQNALGQEQVAGTITKAEFSRLQQLSRMLRTVCVQFRRSTFRVV